MKNSIHWASQKERGTVFFLRLTAWLVHYLPLFLMKPIVYCVVAYFYLTSPKQRQYIRDYQRYLLQTFPQARLPKYGAIFQQFVTFGESICDRFAVWQHKITFESLILDDPDNICGTIDEAIHQQKHGEIFITSHLGNTEVCRALSSRHQGFVMNVLVHNAHAELFNRTLKDTGASDIRLIQVDSLDASGMLDLQRRLANGEWLAIAGDRIPVRGDKTVSVNFLGQEANVPQGAWLLAGLMKAPVNVLFCPKINGQYYLKLRRFNPTITWSRHNRVSTITILAQRYADILASECQQNPLQWFNFYPFWKQKDEK